MNAPLPQNISASLEQAALPMPWVERIFQRLHGRFGNPFLDKFRIGSSNASGEDLGVVNAKRIWAEELVDFSPSELKSALGARYAFPPSLDEFQKAARQDHDIETLFYLAVTQMQARRSRQPESWPSLRLFWAAQRIGGDLLAMSYRELAGRWKAAWAQAEADSAKPIPQASAAASLPAPGQTTLSKEEAATRAKQIGMFAKRGSVEFIARTNVESVAAAPEKFGEATIRYAIHALTTWGAEIPAALQSRGVELGVVDEVAV